MITKNQWVSITYQLRNPNNELIEEADAALPLEFICGHGQTLEYFEMNLLGLSPGDTFDFKLPAAQAYGDTREEMIVTLPREIFSELPPEELTPGNTIPMQDSLGRHLEGRVREIAGENVEIDFNHRLSGIDLHFSGTVLKTRGATDEELHELQHAKCGGCHSCGSDSGCCH
ncbi:MAG: FKBP-type peptidyl-prolyl cis-trans isomerase [Odoribacteraceae bacterium]|jgi:FKBP-type peptidyl-prolyl cis-trans isomerase SlyD|nr:FKBP-type peptidyl-prolyl cis-trans isomerase [Odoribacteraceae bacterium]